MSMVGQRSLRRIPERLEDVERRPPAWYRIEDPDLTKLILQNPAIITAEGRDTGGRRQRQHTVKLVDSKEIGWGGYFGPTEGQHKHSLNPTPQRHLGVSQTEIRVQQDFQPVSVFSRGTARRNHDVEATPSAPALSSSDTANTLLPTNRFQSASPALATVSGGNSITKQQYTGGKHARDVEEDDGERVDMEDLVRMEIYYCGFCPFCRRFFGHDTFPADCPFVGCNKDLRPCLKYPNRSDTPKAPPRLAQRIFLDISVRQHNNDRVLSRLLNYRRSIPDLKIEAATPTAEQQRQVRHGAAFSSPSFQQRSIFPSPSSTSSSSSTIRTIWPSPLGIYEPNEANPSSSSNKRLDALEKPLPAPPPSLTRAEKLKPPLTPPHPAQQTQTVTISSSISERHRQLCRPHRCQRNIAPKVQTPPSSISSVPSFVSPSSLSLSSISSAASSNADTTQRKTQKQISPASSPPSPHGGSTPMCIAHPDTRGRQEQNQKQIQWKGSYKPCPRQRRQHRSSLSDSLRDVDLLAWKTLEERARFEKEYKESGAENADLLMEIIEVYEEEDGEHRDREEWRGKVGGWV
ncbi:hypothetical protein VTI28DRAFT_2515 [Corynascus sepedonium]